MAITAIARIVWPFCTPWATPSGPSVACTVVLPSAERRGIGSSSPSQLAHGTRIHTLSAALCPPVPLLVTDMCRVPSVAEKLALSS